MNERIDPTAQKLQSQVSIDVDRALSEDVGAGDLTAALVDPARHVRARLIARESAVLCGSRWVDATVKALDPTASLVWAVPEGGRCAPDQVVLEIKGKAQALLSAERTSLNFLQLLSAVATQTAKYVKAVEGTRAQIIDTRKTLPGLRWAQKYAVRTGGGVNHRLGLFDAILIKENHIAAAGGIVPVLARASAIAAKARFVQIEVETLDQLREALDAGASMVLLDNMDLPTLHEAVRINKAHGTSKAVLEISGGVTLESIQALARTGVDRISVGALTKDIKAIDFSMRFEDLT